MNSVINAWCTTDVDNQDLSVWFNLALYDDGLLIHDCGILLAGGKESYFPTSVVEAKWICGVITVSLSLK